MSPILLASIYIIYIRLKELKCPHLVPKYSNCKSAHTADYRQYETLQAIKAKSSKTTTTSL